MRYSADLRGLAFAVEEGASHAEVAFVADSRTRVPKFLGVGLVGSAFNHAGNLAVAYLVTQLAAELKIVTLLVDRVRVSAEHI